jgi:hypothetical protein
MSLLVLIRLVRPFILLAFLVTGAGLHVFAQSSVLATGKWYKLAVDKQGIYRIDFNTFRSMGFNPSSTDPQRIKIFTQGAGMLPQPNSETRISDLREIALFIQGEGDGQFNQQDFILFYGEGPERISFDAARQTFAYEKNIYAKSNYYFITVADSPGKRISEAQNQPGTFPVIQEADQYVYHETERINLLKSGRDWFGEAFSTTTELTLRFDFANIIADSPMKLVSSVMGSGFNTTRFNIFINGTAVGQQTIAPIPNTQYGIKGRTVTDTLAVNASLISANTRSTQEVRYQFDRGSAANAVGYLNYCLFQVKQQLRLTGSQTSFRSVASIQQPVSTFQVASSTATAIVWDVSNPFDPVLQATAFSGGVTSFSTTTAALKEFVIFQPSAPAPRLVSEVKNQNIRGYATPAFVIVTHPDFKEQALRLKAHRERTQGLSTLVVTTQEIFHEFSGGKQDVTAIRDMVRYFYLKNPGTLKALLLFGKGSYDYKDILADNKNYVPTYQSRNSLSPLQTYSSDDYFGFLDATEGEWSESPAIAHTLDIGVGRLPVKSAAEASTVVDKIIRYETDPSQAGQWRKNIVFVADDGDFNIHQSQADAMARNIDTQFPFYNTRKIYLDAFPQVPGASGETSPETRRQIERVFNEGSLIINFTGHGNERLWTAERILDDAFIQQLKNNRLPLLITATCEFGRQDDPQFPSGAELLVLQPAGGSIALVTTARPVNSATNFDLNQAFYAAFFQKENGINLSLGEIFRRTKNNSISGVANRNFSLIGDPLLQLAMPEKSVRVTAVHTANGDTVLKALSTVHIAGEIVNGEGSRVTNFSGTLEAILYDKETSFVTFGNENPPFNFTQWYNALFRGKASVTDGRFELQFILPKNIAYAVDVGKLSLYAFQSNGEDASGYSMDFTVGSSEQVFLPDQTPPEIELFMGDFSFREGGYVNPNTQLLARLSDDSGISISGYGIGNSLVAMLDDEVTFILNDYFETDLDDFRSGTIQFPLNNLKPGQHFLTLQAWDTYNNPARATIQFVVTDGPGLKIEEFANYPNPFQSSTQLYFRHNQSGADLEAKMMIYDLTGRLLQSYDFAIPDSPYEVDLVTLDKADIFVENLGSGIYLARLIVRSLADGSQQERVTKLILN